MLSSMSIERARPASAAYRGEIYIMGGYTNRSAHDSVEKYDPLRDEWTPVGSMNKQRFGATAGVSCGFLYVVGGRASYRSATSIERYEPINNTWTMVYIFKFFLYFIIKKFLCSKTILNDIIAIADEL